MTESPTKRKSGLTALVLTIGVSFPTSFAWAGTAFNLNFSQNSALPSARGLTFDSSGPSETQAFQVSNGVLHLDTIQFSSDVDAIYDIVGDYDHHFDTEIVVDIKVSNSGIEGFTFGFYDSVYSGLIDITSSSWTLNGSPFHGLVNDSSSFHVFDLRTSGASGTFTFLIDGNIVAAGALPHGYAGGNVYFGDGTPTGGNVIADIASISYANVDTSTAVPEPSTLVMVCILSGVFGIPALRRLRSTRESHLCD